MQYHSKQLRLKLVFLAFLFTVQVSTCDICQRVNGKLTTERPELHPVPVQSPWYHIGVDFVGPISPPSSAGNRYILTISDYYTKWVEAIPLPTKEAPGVAASLLKVNYCSLCL